MTGTGRPCFFVRTDAGVTPTDLPISPWNERALNGVAIGGLIAALIEEHAPLRDRAMHWARLTIDLLGEVPAGELLPHFAVLRDGRRMQLLQVELVAGGRAVARGQALRVRDKDTPRAEAPVGHAAPHAYPAGAPSRLPIMRHIEQRIVAGHARAGGPGAVWLKADCPVIDGVPLSPLARAAMAADFAAGCGNMPGAEPYSWPNLDISLFLMREPVGEWICVEAETESAGNGTGIASARLADAQGTFARTHQVIFVERAERFADHEDR